MADLSFTPIARINVYHNNDGKYYLETEKASIVDKEVIFDAAMPFQAGDLKDMATMILSKNRKDSSDGIFSEDLLYIDQKIVIVYNKPCIRKLKFRDSLKIESKEYPIPGLIFVLFGTSLNVYVYTDKGRPTNETILYKAPFYNMGYDGLICMGNNSVGLIRKMDGLYSSIKAAISMFFDSQFSHYLNVDLLDGLTLEELYRDKKGIIPKKKLKKNGYKLKDLIKNS